MPRKPEERAREQIDSALAEAGWIVQDRDAINLAAGRGVAVREFRMAPGHGFADYMLFVDGRAAGVLEAKPVGYTLSSVELQADQYAAGLPAGLNPPVNPLPFLYVSTGIETRFINGLDPEPKTRRISHVAHVHRPETLAEWLAAETLDAWVKRLHERDGGFHALPSQALPSSLRARLQTLPPLQRGHNYPVGTKEDRELYTVPSDTPPASQHALRQTPTGLKQDLLYPAQVQAVKNVERSLQRDRPRALVQMATGSGKTICAIASVYRLIRYAGARRVLFLVDRTNLGEQAEKEFHGFRTPDDHRKFTELYNVQRLASNTIDTASKVVITTIQRLYSMLKGEPDFAADDEASSQFESIEGAPREPLPVVYNPAYPPEYFDVIVIDECHRSIYTVWRQVLEYFDAFLIGLTATPAKHTFGFFNKNLVMEYDHQRAVADGVNVDFEVYGIHTRITGQGATIEAKPETMVEYRDRQTRQRRWERPDEDITYGAAELDRRVVARDQIRTVVRTFRKRLFTDIFPDRKEVPKTLVFAKDDSHAEDIVEIVRDEFGRGNDFCQKITYKVTAAAPRDLIQAFRNSFEPRIAVTVDMISTGADIKPIEIVMFMRAVRSRVLFEQMKGRGVRVIDPAELRGVTPDARAKTHFVIVDCVGVSDLPLADTRPLERNKTISFKALLEHAAMGGTDPAMLSSLAGRLARLDRQCGPDDHRRIAEASGGTRLAAISRALVEALDPDRQVEAARSRFDVPDGEEPTDPQVRQAAAALLRQAAEPIATRPALRRLLQDVKRQLEQIIDDITVDELIEAGASEDSRWKAKSLITSFEQFLADNRDEIDAIQCFYCTPYARRLRFDDLKALADEIKAPPRAWTPEKLWRAYETIDKDVVRGASAQRLLTDLVSLVRYALDQDEDLVPFREHVHARFDHWLAQQRTAGRDFTPEQVRWLEMIRDHIAASVEMTVDDLDYAPFAEQGGRGRAAQVFGEALTALLDELNEVLAA